MQKTAKLFYESVMIILVMFTLVTIWTDSTYDATLNWLVWGIFLFDFIVQLCRSHAKWSFIKDNPFFVIAIIPFDQFFQVARIARFIHLFRLKTITRYYAEPLAGKMTFVSKSLMLSGILLLLLAEAILIQTLEPGVHNYGEALLVVLSYLFFLGHRLFAIEANISIWTLTAITILGIVMQGLALQWAFHRFEMFYQRFRKQHSSYEGEQQETE